LLDVLKIFDACPGDIWWVSWRYLMGFLEIFDLSQEIFEGCPGDIR